MNRIVGNQNRSEIILDPVEAWKRGRVLDAMLKGTQPPLNAKSYGALTRNSTLGMVIPPENQRILK
jgi:hypothetical protein